MWPQVAVFEVVKCRRQREHGHTQKQLREVSVRSNLIATITTMTLTVILFSRELSCLQGNRCILCSKVGKNPKSLSPLSLSLFDTSQPQIQILSRHVLVSFLTTALSWMPLEHLPCARSLQAGRQKGFSSLSER